MLIRSHPYASINWIRFIGLVSERRLSALSSTPLRKDDYILSVIRTQVGMSAIGDDNTQGATLEDLARLFFVFEALLKFFEQLVFSFNHAQRLVGFLGVSIIAINIESKTTD